MTHEQFMEKCRKDHPGDYGMCPPPTDAQTALNTLIEHFLGEGWCVTMPLGVKQVNTQAVCEILAAYPESVPLRKRLAKTLRAVAGFLDKQ